MQATSKFTPNAADLAALDAEYELRFEKLEYNKDEKLQWPPSNVEIGVQDGIARPIYGTCGHLAKSPYHDCGCGQYYGI
jgi:hypothetical protein